MRNIFMGDVNKSLMGEKGLVIGKGLVGEKGFDG